MGVMRAMRHSAGWIAGLTLASVVAVVAWSYGSGGLVAVMLSPDIEGAAKVQTIQEFFLAWGSAAPLIYMAVVIVEVVVAPIPGTMVYLPGGLVFGWKIGGLVALLGNVVGAGLCCLIARALGRLYAERFFRLKSLTKYDVMLNRNAIWVILLLRLNPVTSSDLVSYAAGLTSMATWRVVVGTLLGMAPLSFVQAYFAEDLFTRFPALFYPLLVVAVLYIAFVMWTLARLKPIPFPQGERGEQ